MGERSHRGHSPFMARGHDARDRRYCSRAAAGAGEAGGDPGEAKEIAEVQAFARKAGLGPFSHNRTKRFLCVGDAPDKFRGAALGIGESLAEAFLTYFRERGFNLAFPVRLSTVIALKDGASYRAYIGEDPGDLVGGHYDLDTNRLVIFDFRPDQADLCGES